MLVTDYFFLGVALFAFLVGAFLTVLLITLFAGFFATGFSIVFTIGFTIAFVVIFLPRYFELSNAMIGMKMIFRNVIPIPYAQCFQKFFAMLK